MLTSARTDQEKTQLSPTRVVSSTSLADRDTRVASLEKAVQEIQTLLAQRDKELFELLVQTAQNQSTETGHSWRGTPKPLPRSVRVIRKRMVALGLWPKARKVAPDAARRREVRSDLKEWFAPLSAYEAWIEANKFTRAAQADLAEALTHCPRAPLISILTPVYNTDPDLLKAMVRSVLAQSHPNWELCLANDASTRADTIAALAECVSWDNRIKTTRLMTNVGISGATNEAANIATGDVFMFVDHDDLITPDCIGEFALYYGINPEADVAYSDDDKIDISERRYSPQFKPDWSPALLLNYMYMSHALTVRASLFRSIGGFRAEFDGSQDYDFALRATEQARHVGHIPRILYHWRAIEGSTALSADAKPYSIDAGQRAVESAVSRRAINATVIHPDWADAARVGMFALRFPDDGPSVTIIIPTYNKHELLAACVASLASTTYKNYDVLIVDNGSDEPESLALFAELAQTPGFTVKRIERTESFNYASLNNEAARSATGDFLLFLNNDTEVINSSWLSQMVGYGNMPGVGSVGARLYFSDGSIQHAGIVHGYHEGLVGHAFRNAPPHDWGYMGFLRTTREYSAVTAACMLTPAALFHDMEGFDERNFAVAYNDVDYGFRLAARGLRNIYCCDAELTHHEGKTRGHIDDPREVTALRRIHGLWQDNSFNPNLSLDDESFAPAARRLPMRAQRPLKVAVVSHNLAREGAPNTLFDLACGLKDAGVIEPIILSPCDGPLAAEYLKRGIEVRRFIPPDVSHEPAVFAVLRDRLRDAFLRLKVDVVIVNTLPMFAAVSAASAAGIAAIWCQHESEPCESYFDYLGPHLRQDAYAAFGQAYRVTYVADATRHAWRDAQTRHNAQVIRHGIPSNRLHAETAKWLPAAARVALGVDADDIVLLLPGTLCRRKGQIDIVRALIQVAEQSGPPLRVFIVGAIAEQDYAAEIISGTKLPTGTRAVDVIVTGAVEDMQLYYSAADISICTSRIESAPRVLLEAMAFGLPIITTPVFGIPEIVSPSNALFFAPGDVVTLARHIDTLAANPDLRHRMGARSLDVLESQPGFDNMVRQYGALLREAALVSTPEPLSGLTLV